MLRDPIQNKVSEIFEILIYLNKYMSLSQVFLFSSLSAHFSSKFIVLLPKVHLTI